MKTLLFYTSFRQTWEIAASAYFLSSSPILSKADILFHCNNGQIDRKRILKSLARFPNPSLQSIFTNKNAGYAYGHFEALVDYYCLASKYDLVIHLHPDVFIVNEEKLITQLSQFYAEQRVFMVSNYRNYPTDNKHAYRTDFFAFRPTSDLQDQFNSYLDYLKNGISFPELFLGDIIGSGLSNSLLDRSRYMGEPIRRIDSLGLWHEHSRKRYLKYRLLKNLIKLGLPGAKHALQRGFY